MSTAPTAGAGGVLVTGAGSGIGYGIATELAARGWRVAVNDVDAELAGRAAAEVGGLAVPGDVSVDGPELVHRAVEALGGLTGLVNNAGIHRRAPLSAVTEEDLDAVYAVNLRAVVVLASAALPYLQSSGGSIVNISSIAGRTPQMGVGLYTAAKAGVDAFTRQAAVEWGPHGVRVNAIAPGMVRTAMAEAVYSVPELLERRSSMVPLRRIGTPAEIGRVAAFLLSDDASYVTGQTITVDGGFTSVLVDLLPHPGD